VVSGEYKFVWNQSGNNQSRWEKRLMSDVNFTPTGLYNRDVNYTVQGTDNGATIQGYLPKAFSVSRTDNTEFSGTVNAGIQNYIVEQNSGSVTAPLTQTVAGKEYLYSYWTDANYAPYADENGYADYLWNDIPVDNSKELTPTNNVSVSPYYKANMRTSNYGAFGVCGQTKVVKDKDDYIYAVYDSGNKIWLQYSSDGGSTWKLANYGRPVIFEEAKGATISALSDGYGDRQDLVAAYQRKPRTGTNENFNYCIAIAFLEESATGVSIKAEKILYEEYSAPYTFNALPMIVTGDGKFFAAWIGNSQNPGINYAYGNSTKSSITYVDPNGGPTVYDYFLTVDGTGIIPTTSAGSVYPALAARVIGNSAYECHLVWQQNRGYGDHIEYQEIFIDGSTISFSPKAFPSSYAATSAGYGPNHHNYYPTVAVNNAGEVICSWSAINNSTYQARPTRRNKNSNDTWQSTFYFYESASPGTITLTQSEWKDNSNFIVGWQKENISRYKLSDAGSTIKSFNLPVNNGAQVFLAPGNVFKAMAPSITPPAAINLSSQAVLSKSYERLNTAREGTVYTDSTSFFFSIGDILLDGTSIDFSPVPDTVTIKSSADLNRILETPSFNLNNNSQLFYSVGYGVNDIEKAERNLAANDEISFRVELVEAATGNIIGIFDDVKYSKENLKEYINIAYKVNTEGIGNRKVKLRLVTGTKGNSKKAYSVADIYNSEEGLAKSSAPVEVKFMGSLAVENYALEQNYPNPFNPSTTIKYQILENGMVTLKIFNILGEEVATLVNGFKNAGRYEVKFDASNLASGVYVYRLSAGDFNASHKMLLLK